VNCFICPFAEFNIFIAILDAKELKDDHDSKEQADGLDEIQTRIKLYFIAQPPCWKLRIKGFVRNHPMIPDMQN
jgi:hypothetical protein